MVQHPIYAFIHIPKTAGSTVRGVLRREFGARHCDIKAPRHQRGGHRWLDSGALNRARLVYPRLESVCGHRVTAFNGLRNAAPSLRFYTFVRHPIDRFVSHFHHIRRRDPAGTTTEQLEAFCRDPWRRNVQTRWLGGNQDPARAIRALEEHIGFVGLTEAFDASMLLLAQWLGKPGFNPVYEPLNLRHAQIPSRVLEHPECWEWVEDANRADMEVYGYIRDVLFPRQAAAYGGDLERDIERLRAAGEGLSLPRERLFPRVKRNLVYKPLLHLGV